MAFTGSGVHGVHGVHGLHGQRLRRIQTFSKTPLHLDSCCKFQKRVPFTQTCFSPKRPEIRRQSSVPPPSEFMSRATVARVSTSHWYGPHLTACRIQCFHSASENSQAQICADIIFLREALMGDLPGLQEIVEELENAYGSGKVQYSTLKTPDDYNALHLAARAGKTDVCRFLIEKLNFDINGTTNGPGETPLHLSIARRHHPTTSFLIDNGADVTKRNILGETPLHYAAMKGSKETVKLLISNGADLNAMSDCGMPLNSAARSGNHDVLKYLLDLKADPNPTISSSEWSPLFSSLISGSIECMDLLLKAGADPDCPCYLATPLRFAAGVRDVGIIRHLLEAGADANIPDYVGHTPLEHAAMMGRREVVELLFPVTSRIPGYPDWSISGLLQHAESEDAQLLFESKLEKVAQLGKAKGREAFLRKNYVAADQWYTQAAEADPTDVQVLSNRSLCSTKMNRGRAALVDAQACVELDPCWAEAHYREGAAWNVLKNFEKAAEAFSRALALDPSNEDIKKAYMEAQAERNKFSHWSRDGLLANGDLICVGLFREVDVYE